MLKNLGIVFVIIFLAGCSNVHLQEIKTYGFERVLNTQSLAKRTSKTLVVDPVTAAEPYTFSKMYYERTPYLLEHFVVNKWVSAPAKLLYPVVVESLQNSNGFKAVVTRAYGSNVDYRLKIKLLMLKQSFLDNPSQMELAFKAELFKAKTGAVVAARRFYYKFPAVERSPYGGVLAANKAIAQGMLDLAKFVIKTT